MLNKNEILSILAVTLILGFSMTLLSGLQAFFYAILTIFVIILVNIAGKKVMSFYLDSEIEIKLWEIKRYGFRKTQYFRKPFPMGAALPVVSSIFTYGAFAWLASLTFDVKAKVYRAAKRFGLYSFSEMTEWHIGLIAAAGILSNLFAAFIAYLLNFPLFVEVSILFTFYNLIPISNLDGNKIFFGSKVLWSFLFSLILLGLTFIFFVY